MHSYAIPTTLPLALGGAVVVLLSLTQLLEVFLARAEDA